jgi:hypothetical protein
MAEGTSGANDSGRAAQSPTATDGAELRPLLLLLVLDGAVGLWSSLHAPWLQRFFFSQIPLVGLIGLVWGLLGEDVKKGVTARITGGLRKPLVYRVLIGIAVAFFVVTLVRSTVEVRALDPTSSEVFFAVSGAPRDVPPASAPIDSVVCAVAKPAGAAPTSQAVPRRAPATVAIDSMLLNRLTTPIAFGIWTWPTGRDVWFHTATHVSPRAIRVWPWWRRTLQYPEEFDEVARVRVLPLYTLFIGQGSGCAVTLVIREHDSTGVLLAADTLSLASLSGLLLSYRDSIPLDSLAHQRWDEALRKSGRRRAEMDSVRSGGLPPDSASFAQIDSTGAIGRGALVRKWSSFRVVRTRRPLHVGEQIHWEVRGAHRSLLASGEIPLTHETAILLGNP